MLWDPKHDQKVTLAPWRQLILDGADLIERQGLCKFTARNQAGQHCISGALQDAGGIKDVDAFWNAFNVLTKAAPREFGSYVAFNNAPETTKADVVAFMRKAAHAPC